LDTEIHTIYTDRKPDIMEETIIALGKIGSAKASNILAKLTEDYDSKRDTYRDRLGAFIPVVIEVLEKSGIKLLLKP